MRVIAFWAAVAGLIVLAGQGAILGFTLVWTDHAELLSTAYLVGSIGQILFTLLTVVFFIGFSLTERSG